MSSRLQLKKKKKKIIHSKENGLSLAASFAFKICVIRLNQLVAIPKRQCFWLTVCVTTSQFSLRTVFEFGFKKHAHTLSVPFRTSQRLYLVSRGVDKKPHSLVCQLILVKKKKKKRKKEKKLLLSCLCFLSWAHSFRSLPLSEIKSWVQLNLYPNESDPPRVTTQGRSRRSRCNRRFFKRQFFSFDANLGCSYRTGLQRRITRWLLVILCELELWILVQEVEVPH